MLIILCFHEEKEAHARPLLTEVNVLNVCQINLRQILTFIQKVKKYNNPLSIFELFLRN